MTNIQNKINDFIKNRTVVILGFGREGQSTYSFLRYYFPQKTICIADSNEAISEHGLLKCDDNISFELGDDYLSSISEFEIVFKSPGISFKNYIIPNNQIISSQTDLFLKLFSKQIIGVTGTKGKSTTVSLLYHILKEYGEEALLVGNIGKPALEVVNQINDNTIILYEMSSHQLEFVSNSPHISILLNLYEEHLDHYNSYKDYRFAKWNIAKYQNESDFLIYCEDETQLLQDKEFQLIKSKLLNYSFGKNALLCYNNNVLFDNKGKEIDIKNFKILGKHNKYNLMAALLACSSLGLDIDKAIELSYSFNGLPHRIEFAGVKQGIKFYNDSIATIPQATIRAIESVDDIETLILGGFDRGIDYSILINYLTNFRPLNILLVGDVGRKIEFLLKESNYHGKLFFIDNFDNIITKVIKCTKEGNSCLLSPAASSYDLFKNFEERGDRFKYLISKV